MCTWMQGLLNLKAACSSPLPFSICARAPGRPEVGRNRGLRGPLRGAAAVLGRGFGDNGLPVCGRVWPLALSTLYVCTRVCECVQVC